METNIKPKYSDIPALKVSLLKDSETMEEKKTLNQVISDTICYNENALELLKEFQAQFINPTTGGLKDMSFQQALLILQVIWNKVKETSEECADKPLVIEINGEGIMPTVLKLLLQALGLTL